VFVQASTLPGWLQAWVSVNPVSALTTACRGLILGGSVATPTLHTMLWIAGILAVAVPLALRAYRKRT
jgi:oleandomycin transport system permease protein